MGPISELCVCIAADDCSPTADGSGYTGRVSVTKSGIQCQEWNRQIPHEHQYAQEPSVAGAVNYCRNPDPNTHVDGPWCYTVNSSVVSEPCDVLLCGLYIDIE